VQGIPADRVPVAESGISGVEDAARYFNEGAKVILVGEALVKDGDPAGAVRALRGVS
jgi:indole-3-glycerol phosphate synthase